ncbi:hypothetical protein BGP78_01650 [Pseudoalteromonas sp. MSK9-3]|uniref:ATP-binding protein n=1 Tax=Pseudoalteromonas sp. MSK9-3 TaxID=1897633 RepID=UPI000E6D0F09|nr:ATP-binding protein [Pseudoalteromonas sp. MSK9-3]RJE76978.1 hypothetical protein BGP78_01650 [Pseudoalteromonas sp. MSK9-3]
MVNTTTPDRSAMVIRERALALSIYELGHALKAGSDDIEQHTQRLHYALSELAETDRFSDLQTWFRLTDAELELVVLVYIQTLEPDCLAPFLGLNWFEQGPTLSLDKLLTLQSSALNKRALLADGIGASTVFNLGLLRQASTQISICSSVDIAPYIQQYLHCGHVQQNDACLFSLLECMEVDPAFRCLYPQQSRIAQNTVLNSADGQFSLWYASQLASDAQYQFSVFLDETANDTLSDKNVIPNTNKYYDSQTILTELAELIVKSEGQPVVVYWPNWVQYLQASYHTLLKVLAQFPQIFIVSHTHILPKNRYTARVKVLTIEAPSNANIVTAWHKLAPEPYRTDIDSAKLLASHYPVAMWQMNLLAQQAIKTSSEPHTYWSVLQALCLESQSEACEDLAKLCQPRFVLADMVLSPHIENPMKELVARGTLQDELESRLPRLNTGCKALFWGKPGTGKSMAAEAIAGELKLPLYVVNLANIASKWIGESEKHLAQLFDAAQRNNAVLMFDEADAIFAKRSDVESSHDKNANMGVSYLLQRMEHYTGLLLLSTNYKSNLDDAFLRRFHNVIEFTLPSKRERVELWSRSLSNNAEYDLLDATAALAEQFELSGSQIMNITETALLQALMANRSLISRDDIASALKRELEKQHAGFMAQQDISTWLQGDSHGSNAGL